MPGTSLRAPQQHYTPDAFAGTVLTAETFRKRFAEMRELVATDDSDQVVGTIAYKSENSEGHIRGMAVKPQWHGCGISTRLLDDVESGLRELHCSAVTLDKR